MPETIIAEIENIRIDKYLTDKFPYSRNFFHHIIERGGVKIKAGIHPSHSKPARSTDGLDSESNAKVIKKSYKLKKGDTIVIDELERYLDGSVMQEAPHIYIPIITEEEDYVIIDKPKGVLSHPNSIRDVGSPSVVGRLYHKYKDLPSIGNFIRSGLIHRLDKDTDGVMVIAKTEQGLAHFKALFQQKTNADTIEEKESVPLKKFYQATCYLTDNGRQFLASIKDKLPHYIIKNVIAKVPHTIPKEGITKVLDIKFHTRTNKSSGGKSGSNTKDQVTLSLEILTGRTHQIRYHLSSLGLPIIGDYLYGTDEDIPMQLTAKRLVYRDQNDTIREAICTEKT